MSDGTVQIDRGQFVAQRGAFGDALAAELGARLSRAFGFAPANPQDVGVLELAESDEPLVHQRFGYAQGEGGFHAVLSKRDAALLAALEQRAEGDAIEAARSADFDEDKLGAFKQVMASVADVLKRSFEGAGMPELAVGDAAVAPSPQSDPTWIADAFYVRFRFAMSVEGFESASFDLIVATGDLVGDAPRGESLCFVTLGEEERKRINELEPALEGAVVTIEPRDLAKPLDERVLDATVLVIPWDLAGRSGLELVESLARVPKLAGAAILLGAARPTRAMAVAALRAGARAVVSHPYDAAELKAASRPPESATP